MQHLNPQRPGLPTEVDPATEISWTQNAELSEILFLHPGSPPKIPNITRVFFSVTKVLKNIEKILDWEANVCQVNKRFTPMEEFLLSSIGI